MSLLKRLTKSSRSDCVHRQSLSMMSEDYRWFTLEQAFSVKHHVVKAIREGDVSTKRNADGTKRRKRNAVPQVSTKTVETPRFLPNGKAA